MSRSAKKEKFTAKKKGSNTLVIALVAVFVLGVAGIGAAVAFSGGDKTPGDYNAGAVSYTTPVKMTDIQADLTGGDVKISLEEVKNNKIVAFELPGRSFALDNGSKFDKLPLLAYIAPSGKLVVASSICEPCSGTRFSIDGNEIVCESCGTRWTLEDLQGVSGGCMKHPPLALEYKTVGDQIVIAKATLDAWQPRPTR